MRKLTHFYHYDKGELYNHQHDQSSLWLSESVPALTGGHGRHLFVQIPFLQTGFQIAGRPSIGTRTG